MKSLSEFINESLLDDPETAEWLKKFDKRMDFMAAHKTLYDCLNNYLVCGFERSLGPTNFKFVSEYCRFVKKELKGQSLLDRKGKKCNPSLLADVVAAIASKVEIDWRLEPKERIEKAFKDFEEIEEQMRKKFNYDEKSEETGKSDPRWQEKVSISLSDMPPLTKKYTKDGSKSVFFQKGYGLEITISYGAKASSYMAGEQTLKILSTSPILADMDNFN